VLRASNVGENEIIVERTVTKPTKPVKRVVEVPVVVDDKLELERARVEQERVKMEARKKLEDELKQKMLVQKEKELFDKMEKDRLIKIEKDLKAKEEALLKQKVS
jgi:hypothetical protein